MKIDVLADHRSHSRAVLRFLAIVMFLAAAPMSSVADELSLNFRKIDFPRLATGGSSTLTLRCSAPAGDGTAACELWGAGGTLVARGTLHRQGVASGDPAAERRLLEEAFRNPKTRKTTHEKTKGSELRLVTPGGVTYAALLLPGIQKIRSSTSRPPKPKKTKEGAPKPPSAEVGVMAVESSGGPPKTPGQGSGSPRTERATHGLRQDILRARRALPQVRCVSNATSARSEVDAAHRDLVALAQAKSVSRAAAPSRRLERSVHRLLEALGRSRSARADAARCAENRRRCLASGHATGECAISTLICLDRLVCPAR